LRLVMRGCAVRRNPIVMGREGIEASSYATRACELLTVKIVRAHGGCLGTRRRRRTWTAAISHGEVLNNL
jgi:hypothetical protein